MSQPHTDPCPSPTCPCSECVSSRLPSSCPEGCSCLVCLVDSLSANPPPRRKVPGEAEACSSELVEESAEGSP
jgi:hypothetical protein